MGRIGSIPIQVMFGVLLLGSAMAQIAMTELNVDKPCEFFDNTWIGNDNAAKMRVITI